MTSCDVRVDSEPWRGVTPPTDDLSKDGRQRPTMGWEDDDGGGDVKVTSWKKKQGEEARGGNKGTVRQNILIRLCVCPPSLTLSSSSSRRSCSRFVPVGGRVSCCWGRGGRCRRPLPPQSALRPPPLSSSRVFTNTSVPPYIHPLPHHLGQLPTSCLNHAPSA